VDDTFDARLRGGNLGTVESSGTVVEAGTDTPDDGTDTTDDTTDTTEDTPDDTMTTEMPDETETTDDSTPGFGAVLALVAMLAAALLATRRDN